MWWHGGVVVITLRLWILTPVRMEMNGFPPVATPVFSPVHTVNISADYGLCHKKGWHLIPAVPLVPWESLKTHTQDKWNKWHRTVFHTSVISSLKWRTVSSEICKYCTVKVNIQIFSQYYWWMLDKMKAVVFIWNVISIKRKLDATLDEKTRSA